MKPRVSGTREARIPPQGTTDQAMESLKKQLIKHKEKIRGI
jgi:ribosome-associated translation inhibitor RaiA